MGPVWDVYRAGPAIFTNATVESSVMVGLPLPELPLEAMCCSNRGEGLWARATALNPTMATHNSLYFRVSPAQLPLAEEIATAHRTPNFG